MARTTWKSLWHDQRGEVQMMSWLLLTVILAVGSVVGISSVRDSIVQQLGDLSLALEKLDQSYSFTIETTSATITSMYDDTPLGDDDVLDAAPACINLGTDAAGEGT